MALLLGVLVGAGEVVLRLWGVRGLMTMPLWLNALSFSIISYVVFGGVVCVVTCVIGGLSSRLSGTCRGNFEGGATGCAAFCAGVVIITIWGHWAEDEDSILRDGVGIVTAVLAWAALSIPAAWGLTRLGRTVLGRAASKGTRIGACLAAPIIVGAIGVQWHGRSRLASADGFWTPHGGGSATTTSARAAPNVVLIVFDTLRADRLGCYGYGRATSPHIDAFAADAVRFENAISPGIWTEPAHASIFTGLYRSQHGVGWNRIWLDEKFVTLAEILRDRGYDTIALSNNPNVSPATNLMQGFSRFVEPFRLSVTNRNALYNFLHYVCVNERSLGRVLGRWFVYDAGGGAVPALVSNYLGARDRARPFLLFINYMEAHSPFEPRGAYRQALVPPADLSRSYGLDQSPASVYGYTLAGASVYGDADMRLFSELYDARVRELDDCFADLMRVLRARLDLDDTLVILTADHGENLGDHGMLEHHCCIYNTLIHVPLIVRWPRRLKPARLDHLVQTHDLFPSVLGWVGAEVTQTSEVLARPLSEAMESTSESAYRSAFAEFLSPPRWAFKIARRVDPNFDESKWMVAFRTILTRRRKLIVRSDQRVELYDWTRDRGETHDLASTDRADVNRLNDMLQRWRRSFKPFDPNQFTGPAGQRPDAEQIQRLRNLGYVQ